MNVTPIAVPQGYNAYTVLIPHGEPMSVRTQQLLQNLNSLYTAQPANLNVVPSPISPQPTTLVVPCIQSTQPVSSHSSVVPIVAPSSQLTQVPRVPSLEELLQMDQFQSTPVSSLPTSLVFPRNPILTTSNRGNVSLPRSAGFRIQQQPPFTLQLPGGNVVSTGNMVSKPKYGQQSTSTSYNRNGNFGGSYGQVQSVHPVTLSTERSPGRGICASSSPISPISPFEVRQPSSTAAPSTLPVDCLLPPMIPKNTSLNDQNIPPPIHSNANPENTTTLTVPKSTNLVNKTRFCTGSGSSVQNTKQNKSNLSLYIPSPEGPS